MRVTVPNLHQFYFNQLNFEQALGQWQNLGFAYGVNVTVKKTWERKIQRGKLNTAWRKEEATQQSISLFNLYFK